MPELGGYAVHGEWGKSKGPLRFLLMPFSEVKKQASSVDAAVGLGVVWCFLPSANTETWTEPQGWNSGTFEPAVGVHSWVIFLMCSSGGPCKQCTLKAATWKQLNHMQLSDACFCQRHVSASETCFLVVARLKTCVMVYCRAFVVSNNYPTCTLHALSWWQDATSMRHLLSDNSCTLLVSQTFSALLL